MSKLKRNRNLLIAVFFVILTLVGLWMGTDYGVPWDERDEQKILVFNLYEYAYQLLGKDSAVVRIAADMGAAPISGSIERDHGVAPFYPLAPIFFLQDARLMTQVWHAYIWLIFMLGVYALFALLRELGASDITACAASLFLYLSPRFFAEGHYNNKDVVLLSLVLCVFSLAAQLMRKRKYSIMLLFSFVGALAANVKVIGIFAWGLAGLAVVWKWFSEKNIRRRDACIIGASILSFIAFYFLITPAIWNDPIGFVRYVIDNMRHFSRWNGVVFFEGAFYRPAQGVSLPWYYLPKMIALTIPILYILLALVGQVYAITLCIKADQKRPLLLALTIFWMLPLGYALVSNPIVYNGWRHFYFIYAGIVVMAGMGLVWLFSLVASKPALKTLALLGLTAVFAAQAGSIVMNHPYQYTYYNALSGQVDGRYELDYWALSTYNAMEELVARSDRNQNLPLICSRPPIPPHSYPMTNNYDALPEKDRLKLAYSADDRTAPYLIYNTTYMRIAGLDEPEGYRQLFTISAYHHPIVIVYEKLP